MKKLKVLFVVGNLDFGGAEKLVVSQIKYLDKDKFEPHVCTLFRGGPNNYEKKLMELDYKVPWHRFYFKGKFDVSNWFKLWRLLQKEQFDILVGNLFEANFMIRLLNLFVGVKTVFIFEHNVYNKKQWWKILVDRWFSNKTAKIFGDSQAVLDFTSKQEKISLDKFAIMHYPIELPEDKNIDRTKIKEDFGLPEGSFVVGSVARFVEQKGLEYFIRAAAEILSNNKDKEDLYFLLIGYGKLKAELLNLVKELKIESKFIIKDAKDISEILPILDVFIISSLWEAQPISMIEAMAYGCPVVATTVGGIQEIIIEAKNGLLCPPKNEKALALQIIKLVKNEKLRQDIKREGKLTANGFSMPVYIRKLENYFIEEYAKRNKH